MSKRERIAELLRCAADESLKDWAPMANVATVARDLDLWAFDDPKDTRVVIAAWNMSMRVWYECRLTWPYALLEAAARIEEGWSP